MSPVAIFQVVSAGGWIVPGLFTALVAFGVRPKNSFTRSLLATFIGWIIYIAYTLYVYNPAGIAAGIAQGMDSPEMKFDNNTVAVAILGGWILPAIIAASAIVITKRFNKV
jgi:hypothetical protein